MHALDRRKEEGSKGEEEEVENANGRGRIRRGKSRTGIEDITREEGS